MIRFVTAVALIALPLAAAAAQTKDAAGDPPQRIRSVTLRANEPCPKGDGNEIVVCSRLDEPYRIPKRLRSTEPSAANRSWAARAAVADEVGRRAGGLPNTCSPVGSGGQTGCTIQLLQEARDANRAKAAGESDVP